MEKCKGYDNQTLGLYVDGELEQNVFQEIENHLKTCTNCRSVVKKYKKFSRIFKNQVESQTSGSFDNLSEERVFTLFKKSRQPFWQDLFNFISVKKNILQLASITAILLASMAYYQINTVDLMGELDGPSAIVNSVEGDMASVMILETHESNHTIIWYTEG